MQAFKWFKKNSLGELVSDNVAVGPARVTYRQGVANYAKIPGTKLFVFKTLDAAFNYRSVGRLSRELWLVEIPDDSKPMQYRAYLRGSANSCVVEQYWKNRGKFQRNGLTRRTPRGTLGAAHLVPVRRIQF